MDVIEFARLGGQARAKSLSASRRKEIAISASHKRWGMLASKDTTHIDTSRYCKNCGYAQTMHGTKYIKCVEFVAS